jgi:hypothetical protein
LADDRKFFFLPPSYSLSTLETKTGMPPVRAALAQSESKARFFERLGMDETNETHRRLYAMMKV